MSKLIDWINELIDGEPIEAVIIGEMGWDDYNKPGGLPDDYKAKIGKVMTLDDAMPYLAYEFDSGYGAPNCTAIAVYTRTWIVSVSQYDGSTSPFKIPRNPIDGFIPEMPGG